MKSFQIMLLMFFFSMSLCAKEIIVKANQKDVKFLNFYYNDVFFDLKSKMVSTPDNKGDFTLHTDLIVYPAIVACEFYGTHLTFLAFEGQTYVLKRAIDSSLYVESQGRNVSGFYSLLEKSTGSFRTSTYSARAPSDSYKAIQIADKRKQRRDSILATAKLTSEERSYFKEFNFFQSINEKLRPFMPPIPSNYNYAELPDSYVEDLKKLRGAFVHDDLINIDKYRLAAFYYNRFLTKSADNFAVEFESAIKNFEGNTRNLILFRLLKENIKKNLPGFDSYYARYCQLDNKSIFRKYLDSVNNLYKKPASEAILNTRLTDLNGNSFTLKELLGKHPGSVLYIDLWASWCVPCRAEFYFSEKLQLGLRSSKLAFIYLSVDKDSTAWKEANRVYDFLNKENSYLVAGDMDAALLKNLNVLSIPRYMILDANGYIIDDNALRPSNPQLKDLLTKFL